MIDVTPWIGKTIATIAVEEEETLRFTFIDPGPDLPIYDCAQDCCEYRHMSTDDELNHYAGARFLGLEVRDGPDLDGGDVHETQFLVVNTSYGSFTVVNHNEHNGYYGGFSLALRDT